jgi:hypothetical protein
VLLGADLVPDGCKLPRHERLGTPQPVFRQLLIISLLALRESLIVL